MLRADVVLAREVSEELAGDAACKLAEIGVSVRKGVVTLSGIVPDSSLKMAAVRATKRVFGVEGVVARIEISPALTSATYAALGPEA